MNNKTLGYALIGSGGAIGAYLLWKKYNPPEPLIVCEEGTTKCMGDDEQTCINNAWVTTGIGACAPGQSYVTWKFTAPGFWPQHLPDDFTGEIVLEDIEDTVPLEVQSVQWWDGEIWKFWGPGAPGCTLTSLIAGQNYMISVADACEWEIDLS